MAERLAERLTPVGGQAFRQTDTHPPVCVDLYARTRGKGYPFGHCLRPFGRLAPRFASTLRSTGPRVLAWLPAQPFHARTTIRASPTGKPGEGGRRRRSKTLRTASEVVSRRTGIRTDDRPRAWHLRLWLFHREHGGELTVPVLEKQVHSQDRGLAASEMSDNSEYDYYDYCDDRRNQWMQTRQATRERRRIPSLGAPIPIAPPSP